MINPKKLINSSTCLMRYTIWLYIHNNSNNKIIVYPQNMGAQFRSPYLETQNTFYIYFKITTKLVLSFLFRNYDKKILLLESRKINNYIGAKFDIFKAVLEKHVKSVLYLFVCIKHVFFLTKFLTSFK